jgi:hypothetical protein
MLNMSSSYKCRYVPIIDAETHDLIRDIYKESPDGKNAVDPFPYLQRFALNTSLVVNYGTRLSDIEDSLFKEIIECGVIIQQLVCVSVPVKLNHPPGSGHRVETIVADFRSVSGSAADYVPILRYLPGRKSKILAIEARRRRDVYMNKLLDGTHPPVMIVEFDTATVWLTAFLM